MRLAATVSVTLIALSTAALAQVANPAATQVGNNAMDNAAEVHDPASNAMDAADTTRNMLSDSASPPPTEPK